MGIDFRIVVQFHRIFTKSSGGLWYKDNITQVYPGDNNLTVFYHDI